MEEIKLLGARVRALREFRDWSQGQLAYKAGTTASQVSRIENNERPGAQAILVARLADALNTTTDYLVGRTDDPAPLDTNNQKFDPETRIRFAAIMEEWSEIRDEDPTGEGLDQLLTSIAGQTSAFLSMVRAMARATEQNRQES